MVPAPHRGGGTYRRGGFFNSDPAQLRKTNLLCNAFLLFCAALLAQLCERSFAFVPSRTELPAARPQGARNAGKRALFARAQPPMRDRRERLARLSGPP